MNFEYTSLAITKWKLDDFMDVVDNFENDFADAVHHKEYVSQEYKTILLHIVGKSLVTIREILTLCAQGYSDGALSLGRNLYEQMIIVLFFELHKNDNEFQKYVEDFFLSYEVQRNKCFRDIDQYVPSGDMDKLNIELEELKNRANRKIKGDYWWAGCNSFSDLVNHVMRNQTDGLLYQFFGVHYMRYKRACIALHASCMGNSVRIGSKAGFHVVDTSPSVYGQSTPLGYATISLIAIVGVVCDMFQIDHVKHTKPLNELAAFYLEKEETDSKSNSERE